MARGDERPTEFASFDRGDETGISAIRARRPAGPQPTADQTTLTEIITQTIIPNLWHQNKILFQRAGRGIHPDEDNIRKLGMLILGPDNAEAIEYIYSLRDAGISLEDLHLELIEPTARRLGDLWNADEIDFIAVTLGISRLQRIVHHFADLDVVGPYDEQRRALIMVAPGEDHTFGNQMVQKFLRAAGWTVFAIDGSERLVDMIRREWLAVVGISLSGPARTSSLAELVTSIRSHSLNPHIGIMIGGPLVACRPELVDEIGADGTASNAASAVVLAKKLLARGLLAGRTA